VGEVADVALGAGDVAAGANDLGQVVAVVDPAGVGRAAAVAQQQGTGVAVRRRLLLLRASSTAPLASRPTWQCASTRPGTIQQSPSPAVRSRLSGRLLVRDGTVDDVELAVLALGSTTPRTRSTSPMAATVVHRPAGGTVAGLARDRP
jgi:hypothetical protein